MAWTESIIDTLEDIRQSILDQYEANGFRASGAFDYQSSVGRRGRKFFITFPYYSRWITKFRGRSIGRQRNSAQPPTSDIVQWMKDKGIQPRDNKGQFTTKTDTNYKRTAYKIARAIGIKGTRVTQDRQRPIDIDQITNNVLDYRGDEIADRILEDLKI